MEFGKEMSAGAFDWDDSALIEAYDRVMKQEKGKNKKKGNSRAYSNATKPWQVDDYCQAIYNEDGLFYEAKIVSLEGSYCQVEFLGYGDLQETEIDGLLESNGPKARTKQRKNASKEDSSVSETDTFDSGASRYKNAIRKYPKPSPRQFNEYQNYAIPENLKQSQPYIAPVLAHSAVPPPTTHNQRIAETSSNYLAPPPPPMLPCSAVSQDPSLAAMLTSWYMAGYYTGLHQKQKSSHCPHKSRCCDHQGVSNHCNPCF